MKLVIISLGLFFVMKINYAFWGDYYSIHWDIVYYLINYFMMASLFWYLFTQAWNKVQRHILLFATIYFGVLFFEHVICIFKTDLYNVLIVEVGYYSAGIMLMNIGIPFIVLNLKVRSWLKGFWKG